LRILVLVKTRPQISLRLIEPGAAFAELEGEIVRFMQREKSEELKMPDEHSAPMEAWDAIAAQYDRFVAPGEAGLAADALALAGLRAGEEMLDVAAGTGGLSLPAARMGAQVIATDWSPKMIERLEARAMEQGLANVEGRVMDCHRLDFADDTFDVVASQFGVMLVPDQATALREMVRVTKPGGRVVVVAYGSPADFEAIHVFISALVSVVPDFPGLPDDPPPLEFQVADPAVLEARMTATGLRNVTVDVSKKERIKIGSGQVLWDWCLGGNPIPGMLVAELDGAQRAALIGKADELVRAKSNGNGSAVLTAAVNIGIGTK